jgi:hypothetical protein
VSRRELLAIAAAAPLAAAAEGNDSVLGNGWGLDHIEVALTDPKPLKDVYVANLGFTVSQKTAAMAGVEHSAIFLGPAYIEFIWFGGAGEPPDLEPVRKLREGVRSGGGIFQYNIDVSPLQHAADELSKRGFMVKLRPSQVSWQFMFVKKEQKSPPMGVPGGDGVGFIEYKVNSAARRSPTEHANTAQHLVSVWVAVADASAAQKESGRLGFKPLRVRQSSALGARGHDVECGQGMITFWESSTRSGPLASLLRQKGPGPFGFSVGVASLQKAHQLAEQGTGKNLPLESHGRRKSFAVQGELTGGLWLEFVQQ